ncbi:hypothetical protein AGMMS49950_08410 [Endomicrobiia bacterium]|nr:hypothetical protein AGMMS49950_08410 [Endomicrobiia bacterium]
MIISSCDKNNAFLVNRRTATPEKIKEIEEAQQAKEEKEKGKEKVVDEKDKEKEVVKTDPGPTLVIPPIPTLENLVSTIPNFTPADRTNLLTILNRLNLTITDSTNLIRVLSLTTCSTYNRTIIINRFSNLSDINLSPDARAKLTTILSDTSLDPYDFMQQLVRELPLSSNSDTDN